MGLANSIRINPRQRRQYAGKTGHAQAHDAQMGIILIDQTAQYARQGDSGSDANHDSEYLP